MRVVANEIPVDEPNPKESGAPLAVPRSGHARETSSEGAAVDTSCVNGNNLPDVNETSSQCDCANNGGTESPSSSSLCLSEDCILAAATVLSSLDRSADPCDDFYQENDARLRGRDILLRNQTCSFENSSYPN